MEIFSSGCGELLDEVALHEVAFRLEALQSFGARQKLARVGQVLLHQLLHLLLDGFEVFGRERLLAIEVVEESGLGRGAVAELGLGKEFEHGGGHQVRGRVAIDFQRLGIAIGEDAQLGIFLQRTREIDQARAVGEGAWAEAGAAPLSFAEAAGGRCRCRSKKRLDLRGQRGIGQARADALGDIEGGGPARHIFDAAVGQFHMNGFRHDKLYPVPSAQLRQ